MIERNSVYPAAQFILAARGLAVVKRKQIELFKKCDAALPIAEK